MHTHTDTYSKQNTQLIFQQSRQTRLTDKPANTHTHTHTHTLNWRKLVCVIGPQTIRALPCPFCLCQPTLFTTSAIVTTIATITIYPPSTPICHPFIDSEQAWSGWQVHLHRSVKFTSRFNQFIINLLLLLLSSTAAVFWKHFAANLSLPTDVFFLSFFVAFFGFLLFLSNGAGKFCPQWRSVLQFSTQVCLITLIFFIFFGLSHVSHHLCHCHCHHCGHSLQSTM